MERIGPDVSRELRRFGPAAGMADVVAAWPGAVGEGIARNAWPARLSRDGTLQVATSSSAWAFELAQLAPVLLGRLREALGDAAPCALRFQPGRLPEPSPAVPDRASEATVQVGPEERELAAALTSSMQDETLRDLVARAAAASLARLSSGR
jgi:hypothetical protein